MATSINDLPQPAELTAFARSLIFANYELEEFLPEIGWQGTSYRFNTTELGQAPAVRYRAWDTEAPISDRPGVTRSTQELPPLAEKKILTEEEFLKLEAMKTGDWSAVITQIYNDIENLVEGVKARWELDRGELLGSGALTVRYPKTQETVTYPVPAGNKPTATTLWSDVATADIVTQLKAFVTAYKVENRGLAPGVILIPDAVAGLMMRNQALRSLIYHVSGSTAPSTTSFDRIQDELRAHSLPPMRVINSQATDTDGTYKYVLPQNKIVLLPAGRPVGATVKGTTGAALGLVQENTLELSDAPGIVAMSWDSNDPPRRFNMVDACGMPVLSSAKQLFIAQVLA